MTRKDNALWAALAVVLFTVFCVATAHCFSDNPCFLPEGCTLATSSARPGITSAFTRNKNFVIALMPDPNADAIFDSIMLCEGNVDDKGFNPCHYAIPFSEPEGLRKGLPLPENNT